MTAYLPIYTSVNYIYAKTGLSSTEVDLSTEENSKIIEDSENEVEYLTGRKFTDGATKTEILSGAKKDILGYAGQKSITINLTEYPVQSITECKTLNTDGTANTTYDTVSAAEIIAGTFESDDYWLETIEDPLTHTIIANGKIILKEEEFPVGNRNIKVSYTYGYGTVPVAIRDLATCLAGIRAWIRFLGGSYNYLNSYSIPQQNVNKGDFYQRGQNNIQNLTDEANRILDRIGRRPRILYYASGQDR